jgi:hypothetical protein
MITALPCIQMALGIIGLKAIFPRAIPAVHPTSTLKYRLTGLKPSQPSIIQLPAVKMLGLI